MKKPITCAVLLTAVSAYAAPGTFPYDISMTSRFHTNSVAMAEWSTNSVPRVDTGMPATDNVASLSATDVAMTAVDAEDWNELLGAVDSKAGLALKKTGSAYAWQVFSGGEWITLTNATAAAEGTYAIAMDFDYTRAPGAIKVRYSVNGAALYDANGECWLASGTAGTAELTAVTCVGRGTSGAIDLGSGARGAYVAAGTVEEDYSFDYSNLTFKVEVGSEAFGGGSTPKFKITLKDMQGNEFVKEQDVTASQENVIDVSQYVKPGMAYDYKVEVVADGLATQTVVENKQVVLATTGNWYSFNGTAAVSAVLAAGTIDDGAMVADDEETEMTLTPSVAAPDNTVITVEVTVDYTNFAVVDASASAGAQGALALTADGWKCYDAAHTAFVAISGTGVPITNGIYRTRAEFDYASTAKKVSYLVWVDDAWVRLEDSSHNQWFELPSDKTRLDHTAFLGGGRITLVDAGYNQIAPATVPEVEGTTIQLASSTDIDLSQMDAKTYDIEQKTTGKVYSLKWTDRGCKYAKMVNGQLVVVSGTPANGLDSYASYALGLDPETAASKPVLDAPQNDSGSQITYNVANVAPKTDVADITYEVKSSSTLDGTYETTATSSEPQLSVDLPAADGGVKYQKLVIRIKTK